MPNKMMHRSRLRRPGDLGRWAHTISKDFSMNLDEFLGKMLNVRANALVKLLAIQRFSDPEPFKGEIDLNGRSFDMSQLEVCRANELNYNIRLDQLIIDISRSIISDSYCVYERYLTILIHGNPEELKSNSGPDEFIKKYKNVISGDTKNFFNFCKYIRNGLMHYEGICSVKNIIKYNFRGINFDTELLIGKPLPINPGIAITINEELAISVRNMIVSLGIDCPKKY
jgi:hypothetical protein